MNIEFLRIIIPTRGTCNRPACLRVITAVVIKNNNNNILHDEKRYVSMGTAAAAEQYRNVGRHRRTKNYLNSSGDRQRLLSRSHSREGDRRSVRCWISPDAARTYTRHAG